MPIAPPQPTAWLWPDNVPAWCLWLEVQTQWRVGMGGATGLDYAGVTALLQARGYRTGSRCKSLRHMLDDLRACEAGALAGWASKRQDRTGR